MKNLVETFDVALGAARIGFAGQNRARTLEEEAIKDMPSQAEQDRACQDALAAFARLPQLLGDAFFAPWTDALHELKPTELMVVTHSDMHRLSLHVAQVNGRPLIEQYPLVYLPSATLSGDLLKKRTERKAKGEREEVLPALVMGPPDDRMSDGIAETGEVAGHFGVEPYQLNAMKIAVLQEHAGKVCWMHLSTHSSFNRKDFLNSWILFHSEALFLSQLFSDERLEMSGLDLWYQSSCESAGSEPGRTDELMGFVRALIYAGARGVMATLWPVYDGTAYRFAQHFYFHLKGGKTKAVAYQAAVCDLLSGEFGDDDYDYTNPYFSAPFALFGDGLVEV
jgi:CHAT domain-containing protein